MDPLTQMTVGAIAAVSVARKPAEVRHALVLGALAGGAPDLDVLIRSEADPLLALEYHRHFTHALLMVPFIGGAVAILYKLIFARGISLRHLLLYGIAATLTHGLIDACTSYGTLLYWPLSRHRESWDIISIIDPLFTLPLLAFLVIGGWRRSKAVTRLGILYACVYFSFGVFQRERAEDFARALAEQRQHTPTELTARPSFGNVLLWRIVYRDGDKYYVDAVRTFPGLEDRHYRGAVVPVFEELDAYALVDPDSVLWSDIARFRSFSQGYLYLHGRSPMVAGDLRYAMYPDSVVPLWGIRVDPSNRDEHTEILHFRDASRGAFRRLWRMICGQPVAPLAQ